MIFSIQGILKAPVIRYSIAPWIGFRYVNGLIVRGGGILDGQGSSSWPLNDCDENKHCIQLPTSMRFDFVTNSRVHDITSLNSKSSHFNLFACDHMSLSQINITAPENSPNTDGIHIGNSNRITISQSVISTGDDFISFSEGSRRIHIYYVFCGPGHGISIGSLGNFQHPRSVDKIFVKNCTFKDTTDGVRIKTWAANAYQGIASNILFRDIRMEDVLNPIMYRAWTFHVDEETNPVQGRSRPSREIHLPAHLLDYVVSSTRLRNKGKEKSPSKVQIHNVAFINIYGTSTTKVAVNLKCSRSYPCRNLWLQDINLVYQNGNQREPAKALCS